MDKQLHTGHDRFFRTMIQDRRIAKGLLKQFLPGTLLSEINLESIEYCNKSFVEANLKEEISDCLIKVKYNDNDAYILFLIEHQSKPDRLMPLRVLKYSLLAMESFQKENKLNSFPLVYPIVFYNGKQSYDQSTDIRYLINAPDKLIDDFLLRPFQLIDLSKIPDAKFREECWSGILGLTMKHIHDQDLFDFYRNIIEILSALGEDGLAAGESIIYYTINKGNVSKLDELISLLEDELPQLRDKIMTTAERLIEQGMQQGMQQGVQQGMQKGYQKGAEDSARNIVLSLIKHGMNLVKISEMTSLPQAEIQRLMAESEGELTTI